MTLTLTFTSCLVLISQDSDWLRSDHVTCFSLSGEYNMEDEPHQSLIISYIGVFSVTKQLQSKQSTSCLHLHMLSMGEWSCDLMMTKENCVLTFPLHFLSRLFSDSV